MENSCISFVVINDMFVQVGVDGWFLRQFVCDVGWYGLPQDVGTPDWTEDVSSGHLVVELGSVLFGGFCCYWLSNEFGGQKRYSFIDVVRSDTGEKLCALLQESVRLVEVAADIVR